MDKKYKMVSDEGKCEILKDDRIVAVGVRCRRLYKMMFRVLMNDEDGSAGGDHGGADGAIGEANVVMKGETFLKLFRM